VSAPVREATGGLVWGVVLAAGSGERFGERKQFALLGEQRLVDRAVAITAAACDEVVVVLPPGASWHGPPVAAVVAGGASRAESVRAALTAVSDAAEVIVIHDSVHPVASEALFASVIGAVRAGADGAVPVLAVTQVIAHQADGRLFGVLPKPNLVEVQMPHAFAARALRAAHHNQPEVSDEATLLVERGANVVTVPGERTNVHVTTAGELAMVAKLLA
jgi:2-C-methyl-D-erythritol 4-phosphate cytidylyltransferase